MTHFIALNVALELVEALGALLAQVQQHDPKLAAQLRAAGTSVPSCFSEGAQRTGRDRLHLYRTAGGSAAEVRTQLKIAVAWGFLPTAQAERALALADSCVALAWRLTHPRR
jgi:four helix bundle protein